VLSASEELNFSREALIWRGAEGAEGLVVPLMLAAGSSAVEHEAITPSGVRYLIGLAADVPGFTGTVYVMSDRRHPGYLKIGFSKDAGERMRRSSSSDALCRIKMDDRLEIAVLLCYDVEPKLIEKQLHRFFRNKRVKIGSAVEWFKVHACEIMDAVQVLSSGATQFFLSEHYQDKAEQDAFRNALYQSQTSRAPMLAELGEVHCIMPTTGRMQIYYSLWCPVIYEHYGKLPTPIFHPPVTATDGQIALFADEIRRLTPPDDRCILDVHEIDGCLYPRHSDQHIESCKETGWLSSDAIWDPSMTLDEWVVERTIYKVDFSVRLDILDTFEFQGNEMVLRERVVLQ
tara:strand:+ start:13800 stop:14834 length:1035 start_codon:yes stop_codon:yes gene_type:complete